MQISPCSLGTLYDLTFSVNWPVLLCESLASKYCICIPFGLDLIQATVSGFPSGVQQCSQIHAMVCQPQRARAFPVLWSSEIGKRYLGFFIPDHPSTPPAVCTCLLIGTFDRYLTFLEI